MITARSEELFYDAQASLRLVSEALDDLQLPADMSLSGVMAFPVGAAWQGRTEAETSGLSEVLAHTYTETADILRSIRRSRNVLERAAEESLRYVTEESSGSTTDFTTGPSRFSTDLMAAESDSGSAQQLSYALSALLDVESRLAGLVQIMDAAAPDPFQQ